MSHIVKKAENAEVEALIPTRRQKDTLVKSKAQSQTFFTKEILIKETKGGKFENEWRPRY